jgi:hypothetical protein
MTYRVDHTITLPAFEDMPAFKATVIEIVGDVLCFIREDDTYGEIEIEVLEEMLSAL